jgi:ubiquinone/menaquinone biosynthesis C-methylase UbiE
VSNNQNKKDFYDNEDTLKDYLDFRHRSQSPNESIEKPAFLELLGAVKNKHILDLGCGDAKFGKGLLEEGCASYTGIEPSTKMLEYAKRNLQNTKSKVEQASIEAWHYPESQFDVVVSRLVFHYVEDLDTAFIKRLNQMVIWSFR